jgi:ParB family chromosome partitioning protein
VLFEYKTVSIKNIDLEDRTYLFSYPRRNVFLRESIKSIGLLQPPLLFSEKENSKFQIICGEGRILACYELNISEIPALIVFDKTPKDLLLLSLESNLFRPLNLVEKAEFINRSLKIFSIEEVIKLLPKLNLNPSYHWIEFFQAIAILEEDFKNLLVEEILNPKIAKVLAELSLNERKEFLEVLKKLNLSFSEQKEVLEKLLDYKKRKDLASLLPEVLKEFLEEKDFNKRKRNFLNTLNELYNPYYFSKLKNFSSLIEIFKKKQINISFSPYFEKKELELHLKGTSLEDLKEKINFIEKQEETLKKIFDEL